MPISSPPRPSDPTKFLRRLWLPACLLLATVCTTSAQVLVRPGWKDSGLHADPWWKHAIFYNVGSSETDFKALTVRLDALKSLDVDALILPAPALPVPGSNGAMPELEDFDELLRQASRHGIRVLLTIQAPSANADLSGLARFWLNRGVAGLHIASPAGTSEQDKQALVQSVVKQASTALGQRIILSDSDLASPATTTPSRQSSHRALRSSSTLAAQLQIDNGSNSLATLDATTLRPLLAQAIMQPNLILDLRGPDSSKARAPLAESLAAIALITQPAALIESSANLVLQPTPEHQEAVEQPAKPAPIAPPAPPPGTYLPYVPYVPPSKPKAAESPKPVPEDPLTTWYRQLSALHHDNSVLRTGNKIFLDFDAQNALVWVTKPAANSPRLTAPVFVICNLSATPLQLSFADAMKKLDLNGFFLRTILRTDHAMGAQDINSVNVPAFSVYIGDLHR